MPRSSIRKLLWLTLILAFGCELSAQRTASLRCTDSPDKASHPTLAYNFYRATGACPASGSPTGQVKLNSTPVSACAYSDSTIDVGSWCYTARSFLNGAESKDSTTAQADIPPAPPSGLQIASVTMLNGPYQTTVTAKWTAAPGTTRAWLANANEGTLKTWKVASTTGNYSATWTGNLQAKPPYFVACDANVCANAVAK